MSAVNRRRDKAMMTYHSAAGVAADRAQKAVEVATQVHVTGEVVEVILREVDRVGVQNGGIEAGFAVALTTVLGFEVVGQRGDLPQRSPDQAVFHLTLSGLEAAVDAAKDAMYQPWNEVACAVHAAFTAAGAQIPSLDTLLTWTEGRKWFR